MPDRRPFLLLVNPEAGSGRALRRLPALENALHEAGATYEKVLTTAPGHATELARQHIRSGVAGIVVVGGDGTLNEAANGFLDDHGKALRPDAWLGPLPSGTGDDFRKSLGMSKDPSTMVTHMWWALPKPVDLGWVDYRDRAGGVSGRAFVNIASFGVSGLVDELVREGPKWMGGRATLLLATVRALSRYKKRMVKITCDDASSRESEIVAVAVANGRYFGGGMQVASQASLYDGILDVVGIEDVNLLGQAKLASHLYRGTLTEAQGVTHTKARLIVAEAADWGGPVLLVVDGEALGTLPATFRVLPNAILLRA